MQLIRPFGPIVARVTIPKNIIDSLNKYVDEIIINAKKHSQDCMESKNKVDFKISNLKELSLLHFNNY